MEAMVGRRAQAQDVSVASDLKMKVRGEASWKKEEPVINVSKDLKSISIQFGGDTIDVQLGALRGNMIGVKLTSDETSGAAIGVAWNGSFYGPLQPDPAGAFNSRSNYATVTRDIDKTNGREYSGKIKVTTDEYVLTVNAQESKLDSDQRITYELFFRKRRGSGKKAWREREGEMGNLERWAAGQ